MQDDLESAPAQGLDDTDAARLVRHLTVTRLVLLSSAFGMCVTTVVVLIVALAFLLAGHTDVLAAVPAVGLVTALFAGVGAAFVPRIERRLLAVARGAKGPELTIPLLECVNGLLYGRIRTPLEQELARLLGTIDETWWRDRHRALDRQVSAVLTAFLTPNRLQPVDGPLLPALMDAIARCGRKQFLRRVEQIERTAFRGALPASAAEAARRCGAALRERILRDRQAATLLRPATELPDTLLRPAGAGAAQPETLLRAAGTADDGGSGSPLWTGAHARPEESTIETVEQKN